MPDISISIDSREAQATLTRAPNQVSSAMRAATTDATSYVLAIVKRYPQQRPGSAYKRTGTLQRSWSVRITGSNLSIRGEIGSSGSMAPYNRYVMDRTRQSRYHRGRWRTIQDVAETERDRVVRFYVDRLAMVGR